MNGLYKFQIVVVLPFLLFLLIKCERNTEKAEVMGIILLAGESKGLFIKNQDAVIAYKDLEGKIQIETAKLPSYKKPACPGDSIVIYLNSDKLNFGKLLLNEYSVKNQHVYINSNDIGVSKALFDNGVLTIGHFDSKNNLNNMDFYTYTVKQKNIIHVNPIGFSNEIAFEFLGNLGSDTLIVEGVDDIFILSEKMNRFN